MSPANKPKEEVFAIIRVDPDQEHEEHRFTVKGVVKTEEKAQSEVRRLNKVNFDKNCRYFYQITRLQS